MGGGGGGEGAWGGGGGGGGGGVEGAYQGDHDEGGSGDSSTHVGPHPAAVQDAHPPGQLALEQGAHLGVEHDLEVTLHHTHILLSTDL